jgi:hypothetical protein
MVDNFGGSMYNCQVCLHWLIVKTQHPAVAGVPFSGVQWAPRWAA